MKQAEISGDTRGGRRCGGLKGGEATRLIVCKMVFRLFFFFFWKHVVTFRIAFGKSNQEGWRRRRKKKREGGRGRKKGRKKGRDRWREDGK